LEAALAGADAMATKTDAARRADVMSFMNVLLGVKDPRGDSRVLR
jgi:hypothetical protein